MKIMGRKIRLAVLSCLLGALVMDSALAGRISVWLDEEDKIVVGFVRASQENPRIGWQDCADAVNQVRRGLGLAPTRTAEACRHRWDRFFKKHNPELRFHGKCDVLRRDWGDDESRLLVECVDQYENGTAVDWEVISQLMRANGYNRSASECRDHWKIIAPRAGSLRTTAPAPVMPDSVPGDPYQVPGDQEPFGGFPSFKDNPGFDGDWGD
jgi:hypothetical protein